MYFPEDMNFQYFFFDTYPGYFLQVLPIALTAGILYALCRGRRRSRGSAGGAVWPALFVCYLTGLICLTLLIKIIGDIYYYLFYHMPSGSRYFQFVFEYDLIPDFFLHFGSENLGNILMYLPFGVLYPQFSRRAGWGRTVAAGLTVSLAIELVQPLFGRSFDINDIILNGIGVILSAAVYFALNAALRRRR
ncbi:VanZ family protein [Pseudoflavonifractor sp. 524-17]|uniref:VanZ family protein n=1 Tax=Pseudoflavonifractor sp. 524-17 TaxID=2304577 RepID=UPI00137A36D7